MSCVVQKARPLLSQDVFVVCAEFFSFALGAVRASPDVVELLHDFGDDCIVVGYDAGLEVPFVLALCAHAGSCEIGASGVGKAAVYYHRFEMDSRAQDSLHAVYQIRVLVEISAKSRAGFLGVEQSYFDLFVHEVRQDFQKRDHPVAFIRVEVFQVGRGYPDKSASLRNSVLDHLFVYVSIRNEFNHLSRIRTSTVRESEFYRRT